MWDTQTIVAHGEGFQLPTLTQYWEMIYDANTYLCFPEKFSM